jgi:hypothetical protein
MLIPALSAGWGRPISCPLACTVYAFPEALGREECRDGSRAVYGFWAFGSNI